MMRILIDARMLLGRFSGVPRFVTRLADELAKHQDIQVAALCADEPYAPWRDRTDIHMITTDFSRCDRNPLRRWRWESRRLRAWVRRARPDVFHATWNSGVPRGLNIPAVLTVHDLIPWHEPQQYFATLRENFAYRRMLWASTRRASCITTVSDFVRTDVIETLGVNPGKIHTVYNGADFIDDKGISAHGETDPRLDLTADPPFALYVGGFERRKNIGTLFLAMNEYWGRYGQLRLLLTGRKDALPADVKLTNDRWHRPSLVTFLGDLTNKELMAIYQRAAVLVTPSRAEGFGLPVIEAMANGCPVIAADSGSLPEIVSNAGLIVPTNDPSGIADAIHRVMNTPELRQHLTAAGRARAASFTWAETARNMVVLYRQAMAASTSTPQPQLGLATCNRPSGEANLLPC